jgi:phospholipid/cholesterol/gamma-HCH transport system ATP-binding protein
MPGEQPILEVKHVNLQFDQKWALRDISLSVCPGETFIILGSAGSGKTMLLKSIIGLTRVTSGEILLFGEDVTKKSEKELFTLRGKVGFLFQEGGLFDSLLVGENVEYPLTTGQDHVAEDEAERRAREALCFVELAQTMQQFPSELSGGMRRRVGIARASVTNPPLILYDSPTAGLDPITANTIMAVVAKQRDVQKTASLIVTHRYQDGELMAKFEYDANRKELVPVTDGHSGDGARRTRFIVMKEGEIVFFGTIHDLEASQDEYVRRFIRHEG